MRACLCAGATEKYKNRECNHPSIHPEGPCLSTPLTISLSLCGQVSYLCCVTGFSASATATHLSCQCRQMRYLHQSPRTGHTTRSPTKLRKREPCKGRLVRLSLSLCVCVWRSASQSPLHCPPGTEHVRLRWDNLRVGCQLGSARGIARRTGQRTLHDITYEAAARDLVSHSVSQSANQSDRHR